MRGSKTFEIRHWAKVGCLGISNGVNTKVALQESNHLLSVKRIKIEKERVENIIMGIQFV